jgi:hypothetical protein
VNKNVVMARLRNYRSTEDFLLQPHKIPHAVYSNILDIIQTELAPHMQRYARLRRRVLGLDKLLYCDIKAPLDPAFNPRMSYEDGCQLILDALAVMGPQYCDFARKAMEQRWVDRADNIGKSSGAFCASPYGVHPYILITWSNTMRNVFTLAHELGHGGHFSLAMQHQRFVNVRPAMPFVEAPSIMNEMLLAQHILGKSQETRMRRSVIMQVLGTYHHNFVTHLLEAELQRQVYALAERAGSITAAVLNERKGRILAKFWGDTVDIDEGARMTWMRQPHYYMGLYPYTYSGRPRGIDGDVASGPERRPTRGPALAGGAEGRRHTQTAGTDAVGRHRHEHAPTDSRRRGLCGAPDRGTGGVVRLRASPASSQAAGHVLDQGLQPNSGPSSWRTSHSTSQSVPCTLRKRRVSSTASSNDGASKIA